MPKKGVVSIFLSLAVLVSLFVTPLSASAAYALPDTVALSADAAYVVSLGALQEDDVVLYEKNAETTQQPAALVRLMAGALAFELIEEQGLNLESDTGAYTMACWQDITGTGLGVMNMEIEESWTLKDLVTATLILGAADACVTLAVRLAGSHQAFVQKMNEKAAQLGCVNTSFANVTGLNALNQYTCAADMYRIMRYAMDFPLLVEYSRQTLYTVNPVSGGSPRTMPNTNDMLRSSTDSYYSPMVFGKAGAAALDDRSMVSVARDSGYEYLVVVMGSSDAAGDAPAVAHYRDTYRLFKWAFNNFSYQTLLSKNEPIAQLKVNLAWDTDTVSLIPERELATVVVNGLESSAVRQVVTLQQETVDAPVEKGKVYGKVEIFINMDQKIGEVNLIAADSVEASQLLVFWERVKSFLTSPWFWGGLIVLVVLLIGYIILNVVHNQRRKRRRMKRVKRYR